jgi:hypothetical protein
MFLTSFSDHPVILSAGTAVAVLTVCTGITFTWIVPTMVASANNKLEATAAELSKVEKEKEAAEAKSLGYQAEIKELNSRVAAITKERTELAAEKDKRIADLQMELFETQTLNMFVSGSPYPVGFDKVRLGDPIAKVADEYKLKNESDSSLRIVLKPPSQVFKWVIFDYNTQEKDIVEAVSFDIGTMRAFRQNPKPPLPDNWIEKTLIRVLGDPKAKIGPDEKCFVWSVGVAEKEKALVLYRQGDTQYTISNVICPPGCYFTKEQMDKFDRKKT